MRTRTVIMRILGIDGGIGSVGWAVIEVESDQTQTTAGRILGAGVRTFEVPEDGAGTKRRTKNEIRRTFRGQRRVIRRRAQRMDKLRSLFQQHGLLPDAGKQALCISGMDPWKLRAEALDRALSPPELAVALGHIARHRGFRSNSKRDRGANAAPDTSKMLTAIENTRELLSRWQTVGAMFARDPEFADRKRNREGDYTRSMLRKDLEVEAAAIFASQRRYGRSEASESLEQAYTSLAFDQLPLRSSEHLVGRCPFEPDEIRAAKRSPSFERFRYLSRLATLSIVTGRTERRLTAEEIRTADSMFGNSKRITFKALRKLLDLAPQSRFATVPPDDEQRDVVVRSNSDGAAAGTFALREAVSSATDPAQWNALLADATRLDAIASIITFREDIGQIRDGITATGIGGPIANALTDAVAAGKFAIFKGAAHISTKAARAMLPGLLSGFGYAEAAGGAGYDHSARPVVPISAIGSPVARKALSEMLKQIEAIRRKFEEDPTNRVPIDRIHVEMARDVGKSIEERRYIENGIERRTKERDALRVELQRLLQCERITGEDLLRYELWKEQGCKSLYSDRPIPIQSVLATDNSIQVDHILPWSRFSDDSFVNKTLCLASENQAKAGRSPYEWFTAEKTPDDWDAFVARVEAMRTKGRKKRNLLLKSASEIEEKFRSRNLNDTRFATRVLLAELTRLYPAMKTERRIFARPGELTSKLRRAWGIERLKRSKDGKRLSDDRHHALDAIVVAATTEGQLQRLTAAFKEAERRGLPREFSNLPEPWPGFRDHALQAYGDIFVSRAEVRRARGKAHDATIKQVRKIDGVDKVFIRKSVDKLTERDLDLIPVPAPYGNIVDPGNLHRLTVEALRIWIAAGKPKDDARLPRSPKGDIIRKVRVATTDKVAVGVRGGTADRGDMVRFDVFEKLNKRGNREFYLVPIYPHEIETLKAPPMRAIQSDSDESRWPIIDETYRFLWSVYPMSLLELTKADGEVILGYCRGLSRNTGALTISAGNNSADVRDGIGTRKLRNFQKLAIDRLGVCSAVKHEVRTWHGKECI